MSDYQQGMVKYLLSRTGNKDVEERKELLTAYYQVLFRAYYNRVIFEGGSIMAAPHQRVRSCRKTEWMANQAPY